MPEARAVWMMPTKVMSWLAMASKRILSASGCAGRVVCLKDRIRDGAALGVLRRLRNTALGSLGRRHNLAAAAQVDAVLVQLDHTVSHSVPKGSGA